MPIDHLGVTVPAAIVIGLCRKNCLQLPPDRKKFRFKLRVISGKDARSVHTSISSEFQSAQQWSFRLRN